MSVYIINQELRREKQYQIMVKRGSGFFHVYPGKLFTIEKAIDICSANNFTIIKTGTLWECI